MKIIRIALFAIAATSVPAFAQITIPPSTPSAVTQTYSPGVQRIPNPLWSVSGLGCPAAAGLPAALASQWTAALAAVNGNGAETAQVQAQQTYTTAVIAAYLAANPQQDIFVYIARPQLTSPLALIVYIKSVALPSGNSCPTS